MLLGTNNLDEFISRYQQDAILWCAARLLDNLDSPILRNDRTRELASILAQIPDDNALMRDDYVKKISTQFDIKAKTLDKMIADVLTKQVKAENRKVRKNKIKTLDTEPSRFPFFREFVRENASTGIRSLDKIKIDKLKFVQLLSSFGFSRYETGDNVKEDFTFVRVSGNVLTSVTRDKIIDHLEHFVKHEYDFDAVGCEFVDADQLINTFYDQLRTIFSKDLFARVRLDSPILISKDKATITYLYFKNGFVEITSDGYKLNDYKEMEGSVWDHQQMDRTFVKIADPLEELPEREVPHQQFRCVFADYVFKICGQSLERYQSLMSIIGYLVHDFYAYNLKAIYFTDSTISDNSEGRTGKTLLLKMIGEVRSYCEIHGKGFDPYDDKRYETVKLGTQLVHINDVSNKGKNRFDIEPLFNDITEGLHVRALYMPPFRQLAKLVFSGNKSLFISGDSAAARILEFELSNFFSIKNRPDQFYGHWFGRDWDTDEWNRFDNFICLCAQTFHVHGLKEPPIINLMERKLRDHTAPEFIEFMEDIVVTLKKQGVPWTGYVNENGHELKTSYEMTEFVFDRKKLFVRFTSEYEDFKPGKWFTVRKFNAWLAQYASIRYDVTKPKEWKSNGIQWIQFVNTNNI